MTSLEQIYVFHSFYCFPCSWILFPCLYFNNNYSIRVFILFSAKDSLVFMINPIPNFKCSSTFFDQSKLKQKVFGSLITVIFFSINIMTWLTCWNLFWWFYYADVKDTAFAWFRFIICLNCFQLLFVPKILEVWLIIFYFFIIF